MKRVFATSQECDAPVPSSGPRRVSSSCHPAPKKQYFYGAASVFKLISSYPIYGLKVRIISCVECRQTETAWLIALTMIADLQIRSRPLQHQYFH